MSSVEIRFLLPCLETLLVKACNFNVEFLNAKGERNLQLNMFLPQDKKFRFLLARTELLTWCSFFKAFVGLHHWFKQTLSQLFLLGVYDGYKSRCPYFLDNVHGIEPSEVHFHIQSYRPNPDIKSRKGNWCLVNEHIAQRPAAQWLLLLLGSDCLHDHLYASHLLLLHDLVQDLCDFRMCLLDLC